MHRKISGLLLALVLLSSFTVLVYADSTGKIFPNDDGTASALEWEDNHMDGVRYDKVNEDPPDNDTTFIATSDASLAAHTSRFLKPAIDIPDDATVDSVEVHAVCKRVFTANPTVPLVYVGFFIGSTDYFSLSKSVSSNTYTDYSETFTTNPSTGSAWTETQIDSAELDLKGQSARTRVGGVYWYTNIYCTQLYMIVNYTPVSGEEWHEITSWTFSLLTRSWIQIGQWNWTLNAREWIQIQNWTFELVAKEWFELANYTFTLTTKRWIEIGEWTFTLITKGWKEIASWIFTLRAPGWTEIVEWTFTLTSLGWHDIRTWLFTLTTFNITYLIAILFFLVLLGSILVLAWKFKKD